MEVKFLNNLGSADAKALRLDHTQCTKGATVEVKDNVGELLVARQYAEIVAIAKPPVIKAETTNSKKGA